MKKKVPQRGYMVLIASDKKSMKKCLYNMVRFERGRAVLRHGCKLVAPTIFLNRDAAQAAIKKERQSLSYQESILKEDILYMRQRRLFNRYPDLMDIMRAEAKGTLCGTYHPVFKIRAVKIKKWMELFDAFDFVPRGNRLVEKAKGADRS